MSRDPGHRRRATHSRAQLSRAERRFARAALEWKQRWTRYRTPLLIGSGLFAGFALTAVRTTLWSRAGGALLGGAAWLMRSPAGPVLAGALWAKLLGGPAHATRRAGDGAPL